MKKMFSLLVLIGLGFAFAQNPVPPTSKQAEPIRIEPIDPQGFGYAEKIYDFVLTNNGTAADSIIGNVYDIRKLGLVRHYESDSTFAAAAPATMDSLLGQITISCYDILDSSGQTDSVAFVMNLQGSDFAANNSDPGTPNSDDWYTIRSFTHLGLSANSAQSTTDTLKVRLPLATHSTQFIRVYGSNISYLAQNDMRCRVFLYRPRYIIH